MERIKLFEDFIFETSSKRLDDINKKLDNIFKKNDTNEYSVSAVLFLILCTKGEGDKIKKLTNGLMRWNDFFFKKSDEFTFDMDEAISELGTIINNDFKGRNDIKEISNKDFYQSSVETINNGLKTIKEILEDYKDKKGKEKVDFHTFALYFLKIKRLLKRTDKDSEESKEKIINNLIKYNINLVKLKKDLDEYGKNNESKILHMNTQIDIVAGDEFDDEGGRSNDANRDAFQIFVSSNKSLPVINIALYLDKDNYDLRIGYFKNPHVIRYIKGEGKHIQYTKDMSDIKCLKKNFDTLEELFKKDEFSGIMDDIFKIFGENGIKIEVDYSYIRSKINDLCR